MLDIQFSPDGKNLIFHVSIADVQYLVKAALRLSPAELHTVGAEIEEAGSGRAVGKGDVGREGGA